MEPNVNIGDAQVSSFQEMLDAKGYGGSVASKLLRNNMNVKCLRTNETLLHEEWLEIDKAVIEAAHLRQVGIADLRSRGLVYNMNGMAKSVLAYQDMSDIEGANVSMDGVTPGERDRPQYNINYLPLPIIFKDFSFSLRELQESRNGSQPLDTTMAAAAANKVIEKAEEWLFQGSSAFTYGGGTIRGYQDAPQRTTRAIGTDWASDTGANILTDVRNMKQDKINDRHYGDAILYIPTAYETVMDNDFTVNYPITIRERILKMTGIQDIKVADQLTAANVMLVQMTANVVRIVEGLPITTVQWSSGDGLRIFFKIMTILIPQVRNDQQNRSGIVHLS